MKDIPAIDLVRADLHETKRKLMGSDAARLELRTALNQANEHVTTITEILASMIHRSGEAGTTITDGERQAAFGVCWLRVMLDFMVDEDTEESSVRVSLVPITDDERKANTAGLAERAKAKEANPSSLNLLSADGETPL